MPRHCQGTTIPTNHSVEAKKRVLLISPHHRPWFDEMCDAMLEAVRPKADIERAKATTTANNRLMARQPPLSAVLLTDEAHTFVENTRVWEAALDHVRQGGIAVSWVSFPALSKQTRSSHSCLEPASIRRCIVQQDHSEAGPSCSGHAAGDQVAPHLQPVGISWADADNVITN